jgi:hypothetical protein
MFHKQKLIAWMLTFCLTIGFSVTAIFAQQNLVYNGGFEKVKRPYLWYPVKTTPKGAKLIWDNKRARSSEMSLKIVKKQQHGAAMWVSENMSRYWTKTSGAGGDGGFAAGIEIEVGGWVQSKNVNRNPQNADEMIYLAFSFFNENGDQIFGQDVIVPFPQNKENVGNWTEIKSPVFVLPERAETLIITFKFGSEAKGTAWVDDVFLSWAEYWVDWPGSIFNNSFNAPQGWFYWWMAHEWGTIPVIATITNNESHKGRHSLRIVETDNDDDEVVFISEFIPIDDAKTYQLSAWIKTKGFSADEARIDDSYSLGFTVTWHSSFDGWQEIGVDDKRLDVAAPNTNWTKYDMVLEPPSGAVAVSVRARYWQYATGTSYWDDFVLKETSSSKLALNQEEQELSSNQESSLPETFALSQNYPNPFNPVTSISFGLPEADFVSIKVYDILGNEIISLVNEVREAGTYSVQFDATDIPSGIYFYRLQAGSFVESKKMVLMK